MYHFRTYTTRFGCLSRAMAFYAVLLSFCFCAVNGLASQQVKAMRVLYAQLVGNGWPNLSSGKPMVYYYYIGEKPSYYEAFPFLQDLKRNVQNYGSLIDYVPYGSYPLNSGGYQKYPFFYREYADINAGTIPDDWTQDDVNNINQQYQALSQAQKNALPGTFVAGNSTSGDTTTKFLQFNTATVGTAAYNGGVYTYNQAGEVVVSFPDNTGYASGFKPLPDGSYTPVYYVVDGNTVTEYSDITPPSYDQLTLDAETGSYSLSIPNYNKQLDKIINKMDTLRLDNIDLTIPTPEVNVTVPTPEVNVTVPTPQITVNPEVSVNPQVTVNPEVSVDVSTIEGLLEDIADNTSPDNATTSFDLDYHVSTNDLQLTAEEQSIVDQFRAWETDIPLIGDACDFGLTALLGRIPDIGTEYVWLDMDVGTRSRSRSFNPLQNFHIRIDLTPYKEVILAVRGWLIIGEALTFIIMTYKCVREALQV